MALPADLQTVDIVGTYVDYNGAPLIGTIEFTAAVRIISGATHTAVRPAVIVGVLDSAGALKAAGGVATLKLPATDDADVTPTGWTYTVAEKLTNAGGQNVSQAPFNLQAHLLDSPIDLPSASPSTPPVTPGTTAVTKVNAILPNGAGVVTLVPGDIGAAAAAHNHAGGDITSGTVAAARLPVGTGAGTVAAGDDSRIIGSVQGSRQVIAGTGLTGGGTLAADRTFNVAYGTAAGTAAEGNDSRLTNARTPTSHAASHATGGSDPVSAASIGADPTGTAAAAMATHLAAGDPHPQYLTPAEAGVAYAAISHTHVGADLSGMPLAPSFGISGVVAATTGVHRWYNDTGRTLNVTALRAAVGTAPTGSPLTVAAKKNGIAFSTALTATITAAAFTGVTAGAGQTVAAGDYITIDVTAIGSTVPGSDLTVTLTLAVA
ncbi:hypothetical protein [Amycolatopsis sp. NPDC059657]|uniref:hypothetical protein n=1 Tax=Amycolatopsis sp. NPDC059657 TaxID=3346899 RepID=UPI003672F4E8